MSSSQTGSTPSFACFQKGAELMRAALAGPVHRVPVYAQLHELTAYVRKIPQRVFYTRAEVRVPAMLELQAEYGFDIAQVTHDVYNIEAEGLGQAIIFNDDCLPDIDRSRPLIREKSDISKIKMPDFEHAGRFHNVVEMHQVFKELTGLEPGLGICAPFSLAANLRGIEPLILDIYTDPVFARSLFDAILCEVLAPYILYLKSQFPNVSRFNCADATASLPIVTPGILKDWCAKSILRLRELTGQDVYVTNWTGERYSKHPQNILDLKTKLAFGAVLGQDPDVEALGPELYKTYTKKQGVPLILGIGASFLAQASPQQVRARVRQYIDVGAKDGQFALYLCNLSAATPLENIRAAVEEAHRPLDR